MEKSVNVERKLGQVDWDKYIKEALGKKVAQGHTLTKVMEMHERPRVVGAAVYHTGATHEVEAERIKWSSLWKVDEEPRPRSWEGEAIKMLPALSGKDLREAARKFRVGTSNIEGMGTQARSARA